MKIYLAGKISGYSYEDVVAGFDYRGSRLEEEFEVLSPMTGKEFLRNEMKLRAECYTHPVATNHAIFERDKWMVQTCDIVFADMTNLDHASIGMCMELAWASLLGKHTVVVMEKENIHRHAFVLEAADVVFETVDEAIEYLNGLQDNFYG